MKKLILISALCLLCTGIRAQLKCTQAGRLVMGSLTATTNTSYMWNINTYGGMNWKYRYQNGTTRTFKIDLESDTASLSYSTGEIGFYQPDDSYNRVICYDVFIRFPFNPQMNTSGPTAAPTLAEAASEAGGINVSETLGQLAGAIGQMQGQLVSGIHPALPAAPGKKARTMATAASYVLVTTLDGTPVSKQAVGSLAAVDKTGLQAGTYSSTLFVDGQPAESANFVVMDF